MSKISCFKAYDLRGKLGEELNEDVAYRVGRAFGQHLGAKKVVVGGDIRETSESLKSFVSKGLIDSGCDVIDIEMVGTEEVYFATSHLNACGGIEVTASHNPIDYNGMKFVGQNSKPIGSDSGLKDIQALAETQKFTDPDQKGTLTKLNVRDQYADKILSFINTDLLSEKIKVVFDPGNGAAGPALTTILEKLQSHYPQLEVVIINGQPDGSFPVGIPNPMIEENRAGIIEAIKNHKADLGIAFDGDFDRCFFFDENASFIEGYYIVGLIAESILQNQKSAKIVHDPRLTWNTIEVVESNGGTAIESICGHSFIKDKMRQEDAVYGGEMSAHHYFKDFYFCDSGMIPWLLIIQLLNIKKQPFSSLLSQCIADYPVSGEINNTVQDADLILETIKQHFSSNAPEISELDGISMTFDKWRFNIRKSNTEPLLRLNVESRRDQALMQEKTQELLEIITS